MVKNTISQSFIEVSEDPIAERAHQIYLERGGGDGGELDDWLRAERELRAEQSSTGISKRPHKR